MDALGQVTAEHNPAAVKPERRAAFRCAPEVPTALAGAVYLAAYVFLDWISAADQPFINYAWNPNSGASIAFALMFGRRMIPLMFVAPLLDNLVDDLTIRPSAFPLSLDLASSFLTGGVYAAATLFLLRLRQRFDPTLQSTYSLFLLTATTAVSATVVAVGYVGMMVTFGVLPASDFTTVALSYWIGDTIGITVVTPFVLVLWTRRYAVWISAETMLQLIAVAAALMLVYAYWTAEHLQLVYVLFVPIVWMAVRTGIEGVSLGVLATQLGFILGFHAFPDQIAEMPKIQALMLVLALTGLFAGALVTERRRTEAVLRLHQESLARFARLGSVGELAAAVAHELNQPLMAAGTYTRLVAEAIGAGNASTGRVAETAKKAAAQVERAAAVVRRLRALVRLDRNNRVACPVDRLVRETIDLCRPDLDRLGVEVHQSIPAGLPAVMVDVLQIEQALLNLVRNSIDAIGDAGQGMISIEAARPDADFLELCVRDSGPGFPPDRVANPFLPLSSTKKEGLGIGLPLCRSLIEAHGGRIWLDVNSPGAAVHFTLPVAELPCERTPFHD
ncbi:MAG TPA: MASE1 domain-containing protein [Xanthobacteraceae bacterium]|jgi:signal transduction histidine kinase|nr:MASE1 domain-containing protein [Xanthobacteraceae bacterium]